ncbi:hypothetical protein RGI145_23665 (plasmid) [Roseomonas gilardii]|uniref:Transglycosylase SLT domain-containing protein n=1 Tax=Roseomonas gilardii TaxID=257708 RepID=A0A1L7ANH4_9PROT|nr:hypothetical protein [Roseomonas gilardii]APT60328.1 hypothetical protein RGI145_23665 [Roseomonas gilardii]
MAMKRYREGSRAGGWTIALGMAMGAGPGMPALAQSGVVSMSGAPEQVIPRVMELGLGSFTITPTQGSVTPDTSSSGTGSGDGSGSSGATAVGGSKALDLMSSRSWGTQASEAATAVGVNPSALAATCMVESQCQSVNGSASGIRGAFQMLDSTYEWGVTQAISYNSSLAGTIERGVDGSMDAGNQAYSAAAYMRSLAETLQQAGISNPTVLDVRGGYNFGQSYSVAIAQADSSETMGEIMRNASDKVFTQNGITRITTVGEWRTMMSARMGDAATQPVLLGV